jgi:hypothetical protein
MPINSERDTPGTTTTSPTPRTGHGDVGRRRANVAPTLAEAKAVAWIAARLPGAGCAAAARIRYVTAIGQAAGWSDETMAALLSRSVDWSAVWAACGRANGITARQLGRLAPRELAALLDQVAEGDHEGGVAGRWRSRRNDRPDQRETNNMHRNIETEIFMGCDYSPAALAALAANVVVNLAQGFRVRHARSRGSAVTAIPSEDLCVPENAARVLRGRIASLVGVSLIDPAFPTLDKTDREGYTVAGGPYESVAAFAGMLLKAPMFYDGGIGSRFADVADLMFEVEADVRQILAENADAWWQLKQALNERNLGERKLAAIVGPLFVEEHIAPNQANPPIPTLPPPSDRIRQQVARFKDVVQRLPGFKIVTLTPGQFERAPLSVPLAADSLWTDDSLADLVFTAALTRAMNSPSALSASVLIRSEPPNEEGEPVLCAHGAVLGNGGWQPLPAHSVREMHQGEAGVTYSFGDLGDYVL